jgi:hypothetical protein
MSKIFGIIGAGKLGEIILNKLSKKDFNGSYGTRTNHPDHHKFNINTDSISTLPKTDIFVICIPPSKYEFDAVKRFINSSTDSKIILISSTSVYGTNTGDVDENSIRTPMSESAKKLVAIEDLVLNTGRGIVIRPSGLYSTGSHPGNFLSGKTEIKNPDAPINLISRDEVADAVLSLALQDEIRQLNLANTNHPTKKEYYTSYCKRNSLELPSFKESNTQDQKTINTIYESFKACSALP